MKKPSKNNAPKGLAAFAQELPVSSVSSWRDEITYPPEVRLDRLEELFAAPGAWGDLSGHRLSVALRLTVALAGAQGHVSPGESLAHVESGWDAPSTGYIQGVPSGLPPWVQIAADAEIPLLPNAAIEQGDRETVERYMIVARVVARALGIVRTRDGRLGLDSLLGDLAEMRSAYPDRHATTVLEQALTLQVYETACVTPMHDDEPGAEPASEAKARAQLLNDYQLTPDEANHFLALARRRALDQLPENLEAMRAAQLMSLEDLARRCAQSLSLKDEIATRRLLAQVSGTTRGPVDDAAGDFISVVRRVSSARDLNAPEVPLALPPGEPELEHVEEEQDLDDREALDAYDQENT